jgi:hypothetical protein
MRSLDEKNGPDKALFSPIFAGHGSARPRSARHFATGVASITQCGGPGEIPASQTTIPALLQCTSLAVSCDKRLNWRRKSNPVFHAAFTPFGLRLYARLHD